MDLTHDMVCIRAFVESWVQMVLFTRKRPSVLFIDDLNIEVHKQIYIGNTLCDTTNYMDIFDQKMLGTKSIGYMAEEYDEMYVPIIGYPDCDTS